MVIRGKGRSGRGGETEGRGRRGSHGRPYLEFGDCMVSHIGQLGFGSFKPGVHSYTLDK